MEQIAPTNWRLTVENKREKEREEEEVEEEKNGLKSNWMNQQNEHLIERNENA